MDLLVRVEENAKAWDEFIKSAINAANAFILISWGVNSCDKNTRWWRGGMMVLRNRKAFEHMAPLHCLLYYVASS